MRGAGHCREPKGEGRKEERGKFRKYVTEIRICFSKYVPYCVYSLRISGFSLRIFLWATCVLTIRDTPNSGRQDFGIYAGDQESGPESGFTCGGGEGGGAAAGGRGPVADVPAC